METFIEIFQGLPVILFISFIFGLIALIRKYMINPEIRRISIHDRRESVLTPAFPFEDSKNNLIAENRRTPGNRRLASHVIKDYRILHY